MPYDCIIQEHKDHVRVEVSGNPVPGKELDDAIGVLSQVAHFCNKKRIARILAIWDVPGHLPSITGYNIVDSATRTNWGFDFKLAIVYSHKERFTDALFVETAAINRGYRVKMFENEKEAKTWLLRSRKRK
jgi:hypothetical protein